MNFKDRLREARINAGMTQVELARKVGLTSRTIQNYELGSRRPKNYKILLNLANSLDVTADYLMGNAGEYILLAEERGGYKAGRDIETLVSEITGLFAGGQLSDDAIDGAMAALSRAYWIAKEQNKKYAPKKYRIRK